MNDASVIDQAREALRHVYDPELGLDVVALGLVYDLRLEGERLVVEMTLTTPGCPVSQSLPQEACCAVDAALAGAAEVDVQVVWDPPWTPARLDPEAASSLGFG